MKRLSEQPCRMDRHVGPRPTPVSLLDTRVSLTPVQKKGLPLACLSTSKDGRDPPVHRTLVHRAPLAKRASAVTHQAVDIDVLARSWSGRHARNWKESARLNQRHRGHLSHTRRNGASTSVNLRKVARGHGRNGSSSESSPLMQNCRNAHFNPR